MMGDLEQAVEMRITQWATCVRAVSVGPAWYPSMTVEQRAKVGFGGSGGGDWPTPVWVVDNAVRALPQQYKSMVCAHYLYDKSARQIASEIRSSPATVAASLRQAKFFIAGKIF